MDFMCSSVISSARLNASASFVSKRQQTLLKPRSFSMKPRFGFKLRKQQKCKAANGDDDVDWDNEWKSFDSQTKRSKNANGPSRSPPQFGSGRDPAQDQIRSDENFILNAWTGENFTRSGLISVAALLIFFIVVIGPPPSDGRCTLPWC
mmetsp:Transcript_39683/g.55097  ORF Transcript_39683/g.55097 Transcript_39683/m.55097 type:complete len:149 (+) Transcript_39683:132-578(+)